MYVFDRLDSCIQLHTCKDNNTIHGQTAENATSVWDQSKTPLNFKKFADFIKSDDAEHRVMLDCSGTIDEV